MGELWDQAKSGVELVRPNAKEAVYTEVQEQTEKRIEAMRPEIKAEAIREYREANTKPATQSRTVISSWVAMGLTGLSGLAYLGVLPDAVASQEFQTALGVVINVLTIVVNQFAVHYRKIATKLIT